MATFTNEKECKTYLMYGNKNKTEKVNPQQVCKNVPSCHQFIQLTAFLQDIQEGYKSNLDDQFTDFLKEKKMDPENFSEKDSEEFCKKQSVTNMVLSYENPMTIDWCVAHLRPITKRPDSMDIQQSIGDARETQKMQCKVDLAIKKTVFDEDF